MRACEQGEDTDDDDNDDDGGDDEVMEVADDIEWDNLENEDTLIGVSSSLQALGPFLFHGGEGTSMVPVEAVCTVGLPLEPIEASGSAFASEVPVEVGGSTVGPQAPRGAGRSANVP